MNGATRDLFTVSRASNGWLVYLHGDFLGGLPKVVLCLTWDDVAKLCRDTAFPYPNPDEPRGP